MLQGGLSSYCSSSNHYVLVPRSCCGHKVSGMLIFIVLNQCPMQVEGFHTRFRHIAVLAMVIYLVFFSKDQSPIALPSVFLSVASVSPAFSARESRFRLGLQVTLTLR